MFEWLEATSVAIWVKESWGWPLALTIHAFGSALMVGFSFIMGLRLIGLFRTIPPSSLQKLIPIIWVCLALQFGQRRPAVADQARALSLGRPVRREDALRHHGPLHDDAVPEDDQGRSRRLGFDRHHLEAWPADSSALTAFAWAAVLVMGRLTAYLGQLYHVS